MIDQLIGKVIKSYELEGLIGTGGFGAVYRAKQAVVDREVAVKIIWPAFANHPNFIRRFEAEAQLVAGLEHPYIVPLYDYWRDPDGAYIVMRYLRGGHLRGIIHERDWDLDSVNQLLGQVAAALALAHRYGVVHRDIKPENILMDEENNAYLADFGIAQILSNSEEDDFAGMGSPAYAAPEQVIGADTSSQSDIYSLGIIMYELLTGQHPFPQLSELSMTEMSDLRATTPVPNINQLRPDLPETVNEIIQRATALDPRQRFPDALSLARAFRGVSGQSGRYMTTPTHGTDEIILNPYKGLRAFQEKDAPNFFGREALVHRLVNRFKEDGPFSRFLAVVGPSGSGKSSVVKAGLLPALRQGALEGSDEWFFDEMVPGAQPFTELQNTLVSLAVNPPDEDTLHRLHTDERGLLDAIVACLPQGELFLFIDQFEEVFTQVGSEDEINLFLSSLYVALTDPNSRLRLVITIRADFYDRPLLQPRLSDLVRERTEVVVPLTPAELERVIREPARRVGVMFDSGLIAAIIAEVKEQPGALPLLQYSLSELFERRENNLISPQAYRDLGGVRGSLARRADELFTSLTTRQREATRQLFLRLITLGEGTEDTRRRALLGEITSLHADDLSAQGNAFMRDVIDILGKARLLTFDRDPVTRSPTVEVTHEAIIREWGRLREWLDESRNDVRNQRKLSALAAEWIAENREPSLLMQGVRLDQFKEWKAETTLSLTDAEEEYLATSIAQAERREAEERERAERERRLQQRSATQLRIIVVVLLLAAIGSFVLTGFALGESQRAQESERRANERADFADSLALAANASEALSDHQTDLAIRLAMESVVGFEAPPVASRSTLTNVALSPGTRARLVGTAQGTSHTSWVAAVDFSPTGDRLVSSSFDGTVNIWDVASGDLLHAMAGHGGDVEALAYSPMGDTVLSGASDFVAILWDVETGEEMRRFVGHEGPVRSVAYDPTGVTAITSSNDTTLILWDVATGNIIRSFIGHRAAVLAVAFSPDGQTVLSGSRDGDLMLWDVNTGELIQQLEGHETAITAIAYSPTENFAVSAAGDGTIRIWDLATYAIYEQMQTESGGIRDVAYTPDGQQLYTGSEAGLIQVWNVDNGLEINQLRGHEVNPEDGQRAVLGVDVSPEGRYLASGAQDNFVRLWNISNPALTHRIEAHEGRVTQLHSGSASTHIFSTSIDGTLREWDLLTGEEIRTIVRLNGAITALAVSEDESQVLMGLSDGRIVEAAVTTGEVLATLEGHDDAVLSAVYLDEGSQAVTSDQSGQIILWDLETGDIIRRFEGHVGAVYSLAVDSEEALLASGARDATALVWNLETGTIVRRFEGHEDTIYDVSISPDDNLLATGSRDQQVILWDLNSGEELAKLVGETETIWRVDFSPTGNTLFTSSANGSLILWDVETRDQLQRFSTGDLIPFALAFSSNGQYAVSGQDDGSIWIWRTFTTEELVDWVPSNRYMRALTCLEREQYRIEPYC